METKANSIVPALFIALGVALAGYFIGKTIYNGKVALNVAEVKGLAERRVQADRVNWSVGYRVASRSREDIPALYQKAEAQQKEIINLLKQNGFEESEILVGTIDYDYDEYRDDNKVLIDQRHMLYGDISIESNKVNKVREARNQISQLITKGIHIKNREPRYMFTQLNEIKPEMLQEATKNARIAAKQFAENAGVKVGSINSARQGSFYVRDAGSEHSDSKKIEKDVRVVTTISFYLTD